MWNSKQNFEFLALLQGGTICLVSLAKNQNDTIRTERGVAFQRNLEEFQMEFRVVRDRD